MSLLVSQTPRVAARTVGLARKRPVREWERT